MYHAVRPPLRAYLSNAGASRATVPGDQAPLGAAQATAFWYIAVAIVALGSLLRFWRLDLAEFKLDELRDVALVLALIQHGRWPESSMISSIGTQIPPIFIYLVAIVAPLWPTPLGMAVSVAALNCAALVLTLVFTRRYFGPIAALVATTLFATCPWAVIFARKVWEPDALPFFVLLFYLGLFAVVCDRAPAGLLFSGLGAGMAMQLHSTGVALPLVGVLALLRWPRRFPSRYLLGALAIALFLFLPYLVLESRTGFSDWRAVLSHREDTSSNQLFATFLAWIFWLQLQSGWQLTGVLFQPDFVSVNDPWYIHVATWISWTAALGALLFVIRESILTLFSLTSLPDVDQERPRDALLLLTAWLVVTPFALGLSGLMIYPHYLLVIYPAASIAVGVVCARLWRARSVARVCIVCVLVLLAGMNSATITWTMHRAASEPPRGTYGLPLAYETAVADTIARNAPGKTITLVVDGKIRDSYPVLADFLRQRGIEAQRDVPYGLRSPRIYVMSPHQHPPDGSRLLASVGDDARSPVVIVWSEP